MAAPSRSITACFKATILAAASLLMVSVAAGNAPTSGTEPQITEGYINASIAEVWHVFTTSDGSRAAGVDRMEVDLKIGGQIRTTEDGEALVEEILAYEPERMLAIRLSDTPDGFPHRDAVDGTWTVIHFIPSGTDMTFVRMVSLGYRDTPGSRALREYIGTRHRQTLDRIAKHYWPKCKLCAAEPPASSGP